MYTLLSSEPLTIHFPDVTEKVLNTQYDSVFRPSYVFKHLPCTRTAEKKPSRKNHTETRQPDNSHLLVVPQPQLIVERAHQEKFAVGRELDEGSGARTDRQTDTKEVINPTNGQAHITAQNMYARAGIAVRDKSA